LNGNGASDREPAHEELDLPVQQAAPKEPPKDDEAIIESTRPGDDDLEKLRSLWSNFVDQIRARSRTMASVYGNTAMVRPVQVKNGVAVISFRDPIHAKRSSVNEPGKPYRDIVEMSLSRVLGYKARIECITFAQAESGHWGGDTPPESGNAEKKPKSKQPSPYDTTRGKAAMNIFEIDKFEDPE
jgi:hypothetical protein